LILTLVPGGSAFTPVFARGRGGGRRRRSRGQKTKTLVRSSAKTGTGERKGSNWTKERGEARGRE